MCSCCCDNDTLLLVSTHPSDIKVSLMQYIYSLVCFLSKSKYSTVESFLVQIPMLDLEQSLYWMQCTVTYTLRIEKMANHT